MSAEPSAGPRRPPSTASLTRIVCGIDGSRSAAVAAEQAAVLAGPGAAVELVAVIHAQGAGPTRMTTLSRDRAEEALRMTRRAVAEHGVEVSTRLVEDADTTRALAEASDDADLLVLGATPHHRSGGAFFGSPVSVALHHAHVPVLVARRPPAGLVFPARILLADDGSRCASEAADLAGRLAADHDTHVTIVSAGKAAGEARERQSEHATRIWETCGREPVLLTYRTPAHTAIVRAAVELPSSLVVMGARGVSGMRAVGSVSERVAHDAPCSVLVARR